MPLPHRPGFVIREKDVPASQLRLRNHSFALRLPEEQQGFENFIQAVSELRLAGTDRDTADKLAQVRNHPLFHTAMLEYQGLLGAFLPSLEPQLADPQLRQTSALRGNATASLHDLRNGARDGDDELSEGLRIFVELTGRRRMRAELFRETVTDFLSEYADALDDFAAAEPLLKGTQLADKIEELKRNVKRKYSTQAVEELHRECANKRRRANLPESARAILEAWFSDNTEHPYPNERQKAELALRANISDTQVSNWFVNVRKRYWRPHTTATSARKGKAK